VLDLLLREDEGVRRRQLMDYVPKMAGKPSEESIGPAPYLHAKRRRLHYDAEV
jgi:hypothetical protein